MKQLDPIEIVLGAVRDAPPAVVKAIATDLEPLHSRVFLTPHTAWSAVGAVLREYLPGLFKSHPSLIFDLADRHPGPGVTFECVRFGEVRMVREE